MILLNAFTTCWYAGSFNIILMMATVRSAIYGIAVVIAFSTVLKVYHNKTLATLPVTVMDYERNIFLTNSSVTVANVVLPSSIDSGNDTVKCTTVAVMKITFPICLYRAETDSPISAYLLRGKYFEGDIVIRFLRLLRLDHRLQLVDIGANIGLFSLPAARETQVLSVEPNWHSMSRLAKAVDLGAVSSNITLVHNAISNVRTTLNMGVHQANQGHAFLINSTKCKVTLVGTRCNTLSPTKTILLNDLLPLMRYKAAVLKVDVEGGEVNIFTESSAAQFFDRIYIPIVLMEFSFWRQYSVNSVNHFLRFFFNRNYTAFNVKNAILHRHHSRWPGLILFKKIPHIQF